MEKTAQQTGTMGSLVGDSRLPQDTATGDKQISTDFSPGSSDTPQEDSEQLTHGQEGYPGYRPEGINEPPGVNPPVAGDVDPGSTESAEETGQDGDTTKAEKKKAFSYNG